MSPIAKENEVLTVTPEAGARPSATATLSGETANKTQPVALEVAVSVNGACTVEGSDKREPFSEATKTVLVFGNGAVIRLSASVAAGQLLFLTNEKTKKEVVCQVVKSKTYRNVSGYVELEFTEPVIGFWGMRFPGDRIGSQPAPGPVAVPSPTASVLPTTPPTEKNESQAPPKPVVSVLTQTSAPISSKPAAPVEITPAKPVSTTPSVLDLPRTADVRPLTAAPKPQAPVASAAAQITNLPHAHEVKIPVEPVPVAPPTAKTEAVATPKEGTSDALKREAARLQEQLSSLLFTEAPKQTQATPVVEKKDVAEAAAKIFEIAKMEPAVETTKPVQPVKNTGSATKSLLEAEEVKIPAWLEPLARNVAAPASTEELIEREKAKHAAGGPVIEEPAVEPTPIAEPLAEEVSSTELAVPTFGSQLAIDEEQNISEGSAGGSKKGLLYIAIAAGVLMAAAGGTWYMRQQDSTPQAKVSANTFAPSAAISGTGTSGSAVQPPATSGGAGLGISAPNAASSGKAPAVTPRAASSAIEGSAREARETIAVSNPPVTARNAQPALPMAQVKKPALGEVHLAAPTVKRGARGQDNSGVEPAISLNSGQIAANSDSLGGGIATASTRQPEAPAAPLPVGGDVAPARLLSSVPPSYPALAKTQHVSGDVKVDALIDTNGHVTTMKVISGPTLLHQSAMDALRQWKYQAATLDGKPVAMHLTVTIQFRLQ